MTADIMSECFGDVHDIVKITLPFVQSYISSRQAIYGWLFSADTCHLTVDAISLPLRAFCMRC